jgi:hypothetical protein
MPLSALSVGVEVPTHCFNGTVHSLFRQACNLRIEHNALLTLLPSEKANVPQGIRVYDPPLLAFLDRARVGQPVACRGGILRMGGADLAIDLRTASRWHIDLTALQVDLRRPHRARAWVTAWLELETYRCSDGFSAMMEAPSDAASAARLPLTRTILGQRVGQAVAALLDATRSLRLEDAVTAMSLVIGLGPGLTPSGDDFLVGYLAGLWSTAGGDSSRVSFLTAMGAWLSTAAGTTNAISGAYLNSAARGNVSEPIATLAQQLAYARDPGRIRAATRTALSMGHTSGTDGVLGLLLGCLGWAAPGMVFNCLGTGLDA